MLTRPRLLLILTVLATPLVLVLLAAIFIATFDWNRARPWLQSRIGATIDREVSIDGELTTAWHWRVRRDDGSNVWSPGLSVIAENIRVANPAWAKNPEFAQLQAIEVDVRLAPLLAHSVNIPRIRLVSPSLDFERLEDGTNNWTFLPSADGAKWALQLGEIRFDAGKLTISDAKRDLDVQVDIEALDKPIPFGQRVEGDDPGTRREVIQRVGKAAAQRLRAAAEARSDKHVVVAPPPFLFGWVAKGTMRGATIEGSGRFGGTLALDDAHQPFPVRADIDVGATEIALTGTITDPASPDAIDMRLWVSGSNLADLYPIAGLALPQSPSYASVGRLTGHFDPRSSSLRFEDFTARVGGSDLAGTLTYNSGDPRGSLTGEVNSSVLQVEDLGAVVGVNSAAREGTDGKPEPAFGRVLPAAPFEVERWNAMDADVHFTGKRVVRIIELPISEVDTQIVLKNGQLSLDPLRFDMAGGNVNASLQIDARSQPAKGTIVLEARKLLLSQLFARVEGISTSKGEVNATTRLVGQGNTIAGILGSSDGSLKILMTDGEVSEVLMEKAGLNVANLLLAKIKGDKQIGIDCAAANFTAKDGVLTSQLFVIDTDNALIDIEGTLRLSDETVDLTVHPQTKGLRLLSLRSPLHIEGTFRQVEVSVDKKQLLLRGGAAIALGLIATPAALLAMTALGENTPNGCASLVEEAKKVAAVAPQTKGGSNGQPADPRKSKP